MSAPALVAPAAAPSPARGLARGVALFAAALVALGLFARLRAAAFPDAELFRSFPSEDGYLMLTVARNLALGRGLSSAAGTLPTNGVQPLATFVQALCFRAVDGDRAAGLRLLVVVYTLVAAVAAFLIHRLGRRLLATTQWPEEAPLLAAAIWFASPATLFHSMNMLESGPYAAAVVAAVAFFARGHDPAGMAWPWRRCLAMGALLGLAFWARNDAVFLMAAVGLAHLLATGSAGRGRRARECLLIGAAAFVVSLPWLVYNVARFGGVVPVSGRAYLGAAHVGANARAAVVGLFEHANLLVAFEYSPRQHQPVFVAVCAALLAVGAAWAWRARGRTLNRGATRVSVNVVALFGAGLLTFYVFGFNAPHFLRRYLFPLSPFLALAWGLGAAALWRRAAASRLRLAAPLVPLVAVAHLAMRDGLLVRGPWQRGSLFGSLEWVQAHAGEEDWVGSFQSGTMGFFHDRTINLDGKVNPHALAAARRGRLGEYVATSPVRFVVDWATLVEPWARADPAVLRSFEWRERDVRRNFAVLGRRLDARAAAREEP